MVLLGTHGVIRKTNEAYACGRLHTTHPNMEIFIERLVTQNHPESGYEVAMAGTRHEKRRLLCWKEGDENSLQC